MNDDGSLPVEANVAEVDAALGDNQIVTDPNRDSRGIRGDADKFAGLD